MAGATAQKAVAGAAAPKAAGATEKVVSISGIDIPMKASAALTRKYRMMFGRDVFQDVQKRVMTAIGEDGSGDIGAGLEVIEDMAYLMAMEAEPGLPPIEEWLGQFGPLGVYEAAKDVLELWYANAQTTVAPKKSAAPRRAK